jgi:hypothetical protein
MGTGYAFALVHAPTQGPSRVISCPFLEPFAWFCQLLAKIAHVPAKILKKLTFDLAFLSVVMGTGYAFALVHAPTHGPLRVIPCLFLEPSVNFWRELPTFPKKSSRN